MPSRTLVVTLSLALSSHAIAESTEAEQRQACTGDAFRLCQTSIPDRDLVRACLTARLDQLTSACRTIVQGTRAGIQRKG